MPSRHLPLLLLPALTAASNATAACLAAARAEILHAPDKDDFVYTTSRQFKWDLAAFFCPLAQGSSLSVLELGVFQGHSTALLAALFSTVLSLDVEQSYLRAAAQRLAERGRRNVVFLRFDSYADDWSALAATPVDVAVIDADHEHAKVLSDARSALRFLHPLQWLVFDDYAEPGVRDAVSGLLESGALRECKGIGHGKDGSRWHLPALGLVNFSEGVVCRRGSEELPESKAEVREVPFLVYPRPGDALMRAVAIWRFAADGEIWTSAWGQGSWRPAPAWPLAPRRDAFEVELPGLPPPRRWEALWNRPRTAFLLTAEDRNEVEFFALRADRVNQVFRIANEEFELF